MAVPRRDHESIGQAKSIGAHYTLNPVQSLRASLPGTGILPLNSACVYLPATCEPSWELLPPGGQACSSSSSSTRKARAAQACSECSIYVTSELAVHCGAQPSDLCPADEEAKE